MYTPRVTLETNSDVNMFLTRHRFLSKDIPRIPLAVSGCWINTSLEREKLRFGDHGYNESPIVIS